MTTRRQRLEKKLEKRQEWSGKAEKRSDAAYAASGRAVDGIPMGQPILLGHHSEKRHRKALERSHNAMGRAVEESKLAKHHASKASGIAIALERSIFSDDPDAVEQLEAKIKELEAHIEKSKSINKAWKKGGFEGVKAEHGETLAHAAQIVMKPGYSWVKSPMDTTRDRAEIRRCRARIEEIGRRKTIQRIAEDAGGCKISGREYVSVVFSEKPARSVLEALKTAGFRWGGGMWSGKREKLPDVVLELAGEKPGDQKQLGDAPTFAELEREGADLLQNW